MENAASYLVSAGLLMWDDASRTFQLSPEGAKLRRSVGGWRVGIREIKLSTIDAVMRKRSLHNPTTGRRWGTRLEDADLVVVTGAPGNEKETRKPQSDPFAALGIAQQEERKRLRRDFVLVEQDPPVGAPSLIRALDKSSRFL